MSLAIERTAFGRWGDAYRITLGDAEMIVVTEMGPRILSLTAGGGPNLLFVDDDLTVSRPTGDDMWFIYGGHRVWVSPESEASYAPDNTPCHVEVSESGIDVLAAVDPYSRLQKRLTIGACGRRFVVTSAIRNRGDALFLGAAWAVTCVVPAGVIAFPWGSGGCWDLKSITYWNRWMEHRSDVTSTQWTPGPDLFRVTPTGEEGKVGTNSPEGWVAICRDDATFAKSRAWAPGDYPDGGCSLEVYTCEQFVELESLSPLQYLYPGTEVAQEELWTVTPETVDPADGPSLRRLIGIP